MTRPTKLGLAALALYLPHAFWHIVHGNAWDLLWACDVAMPLLALGCFARRPQAAVTAFLFLLYGTPMWLLDVVAGGRMVITSPLIHIGGLVVAYLAVRTLGWPPRSWMVASAASLALLGLSRMVTPPRFNVNMVFAVYEGWTKYFPSHTIYLSGLWLSWTLVFWFVERNFRRRTNRNVQASE